VNDPIEVPIGECRCFHTNGAPVHPDGDLVYLRPKPDLAMGLAAASALRQSGDYMGDTEAALFSVFVRYGVIAWNVVDSQGPVKVTADAVLDRLGWAEGGAIVASRAATLYRDTVLAPLVPTRPAPLRPTRRTGSMSRNRGSGPPTPPSPSPSSPSEPEAGT
jgi:hypothetical protein